jgi:hypothetical protein
MPRLRSWAVRRPFKSLISIYKGFGNGQPYYYDYGLKYYNITDHNNVKRNRRKLKDMLTNELNYDKLIKKVSKGLSIYKCSEIVINDEITKLSILYKKYIDENIKVFIDKLKYENCFLFCIAYTIIWKILKLDWYTNTKMIFLLDIK